MSWLVRGLLRKVSGTRSSDFKKMAAPITPTGTDLEAILNKFLQGHREKIDSRDLQSIFESVIKSSEAIYDVAEENKLSVKSKIKSSIIGLLSAISGQGDVEQPLNALDEDLTSVLSHFKNQISQSDHDPKLIQSSSLIFNDYIVPFVANINKYLSLVDEIELERYEFLNTEAAGADLTLAINNSRDVAAAGEIPESSGSEMGTLQSGWKKDWRNEYYFTSLNTHLNSIVFNGISDGIGDMQTIINNNGLNVALDVDTLAVKAQQTLNISGDILRTLALRHGNLEELEKAALEAGKYMGVKFALLASEQAAHDSGNVDAEVFEKITNKVSNMINDGAVSGIYGRSTAKKFLVNTKDIFKDSDVTFNALSNKDEKSRVKNALSEDEKGRLAKGFFVAMKDLFNSEYKSLEGFWNALFNRYQDEVSAFGTDVLDWVESKHDEYSNVPMEERTPEVIAFLHHFDPEHARISASSDGLVDSLINNWTKKDHYIDNAGRPQAMDKNEVVPTIINGLISHLSSLIVGDGVTDWSQVMEKPVSEKSVSLDLPEIPDIPTSLNSSAHTAVGMIKISGQASGDGYAAMYSAARIFRDIYALGLGMPPSGATPLEEEPEESISLSDSPQEETIGLSDSPQEETIQLNN